jgi:aminoglycoside phosphotransferase (APT) family kinase protein
MLSHAALRRAPTRLRDQLAAKAARYAVASGARCLSTSEAKSPLSKVRSAHQFDEAKLLTYLHNEGVIANTDGVTFSQFSHGQSNPSFLLTANDTKLVIRKQPPGKLLRGAHAVDREHRVMTALRDSDVPVPETRVFCDNVDVLGTPFFAYDFVDGRFFKAPNMPDVPPHTRRACYESMIETLAKIHSVDVDK